MRRLPIRHFAFSVTGVLIASLLFSSCSDTAVRISRNEHVINLTIVSEHYPGFSKLVWIPLLTDKPVTDISMTGFTGANHEHVNCDAEFTVINEPLGKSFLNHVSIRLTPDGETSPVEIDSLLLLINGEALAYEFGVIRLVAESGFTGDDILFLDMPVSGYGFDGSYTWSFKTINTVRLKAVSCGNTEAIAIKEMIVNGVIVDNLNVDMTFNAGETVQASVMFSLLKPEYDDSIVGTDLIFSYETYTGEHIAKSPFEFIIYACGVDYTGLTR